LGSIDQQIEPSSSGKCTCILTEEELYHLNNYYKQIIPEYDHLCKLYENDKAKAKSAHSLKNVS